MFYHDSEEEEAPPPQFSNRTQHAENPAARDTSRDDQPEQREMSQETLDQAKRPGFFGQPGGVRDIDSQVWSTKISNVVDSIISRKPNAQFYNPSVVTTDSNTTSEPVRWRAFPKNLETSKDKWKQADKRDSQDEYCEWEVTRNSAGKVVKVIFTCEVPEYWGQLANDNPQGLVTAYRQMTARDDINLQDLLQDGKYNKDNKWNYNSPHGTIVHMRVKNNTLVEAVDLAADATIVKRDQNGTPISSPTELLALLPAGNLNSLKTSQRRHSDPKIMDVINALARKGRLVTVDEYPGLYIDEFESSKFTCPNDEDAQGFWKVTRGTDGQCLRAEFEVPVDRGYVVGDIKDSRHQPIKNGSQLAPHVWVRIDIQHRPKGVTVARHAKSGTSPLYQYIEGRDIEPFELDPTVVNETIAAEWFGKYLSGKTAHKKIATTFSGLLEQLPDHTWRAYAADEGIGIEFKRPRQSVRARLVVFCTPDAPTKPPAGHHASKVADIKQLVKNSFTFDTIAIVAVPPEDDPTNVDSPKAFLQVASFSKKLGLFNFYDRERSAPGRWLYFGSSKDAFTPDTQGLGVFCGHSNGGIVMKEIDEPWVHWHTDENKLELPEDHPLHQCSALKDSEEWNFGSGKDMARMIEKGNNMWFDTRLKLDFGQNIISKPRTPDPIACRVHQWIAHILLTTSVNIRVSTSPDDDSFTIPRGFFFNREALGLCIPDLGEYEDDLTVSGVPRQAYETAKAKLGLYTMLEYGDDSRSDKAATESEAQGFWKVLVPSAEDTEGIKRVLSIGLLSCKEAAALLMVDFWNPIFSWRRAHLMRYVPSTARFVGRETNFGAAFTKVVRVAASQSGSNNSPEAEYIRLIDTGDLNENFTKKLREYIAAINEKLQGGQSAYWVERYLKVAESKRRIFKPPPRSGRPSHPLAEFNMALPFATRMGEDLDPWEMTANGKADQLPVSKDIWHPRNAQAHFSSSGCPFSSST